MSHFGVNNNDDLLVFSVVFGVIVVYDCIHMSFGVMMTIKVTAFFKNFVIIFSI
jgi:hypothetical protein